MRPNNNIIDPPSGLKIYYSGPSLDQGPLPALFYFALSGQDSLHLDPFNQPVALLAKFPIRCFSFTIPSHGEGYENTKAMKNWAHELRRGDNFLNDFVKSSVENINFLIQQGFIDPKKIAVSGLSRGSFIATHIAAQEARVSCLLGYAPLTQLDNLNEFEDFQGTEILQELGVKNLANKLIHKKSRFYIGNHDTRVNTAACFQFIKTLTDTAYEKGVRSPQVEMIVYPSIGHKGHGTPPHIFEDGVNWLKTNFEILSLEK